MKKKPKVLTLRYERSHAGWIVQSLTPPQDGLLARGAFGTEPEWLQTILDVAKVGGYGLEIPRPPPDAIVWFKTTPEYELVEFMS